MSTTATQQFPEASIRLNGFSLGWGAVEYSVTGIAGQLVPGSHYTNPAVQSQRATCRLLPGHRFSEYMDKVKMGPKNTVTINEGSVDQLNFEFCEIALQGSQQDPVLQLLSVSYP